MTGNAVGGDNSNLLSIHPGNVTPGNTTPFNRRSLRSSRRRKRPSSCGPTNRRSFRDKVHHSKACNSQPNSPTTLISPIITVDPPGQNIPRPDKLDVPDCYGSVTLQVPERTVSFSHMNDSNSYLDSQYSDSSNPGSAMSFNTPNSIDTCSASANESRPDWALDGAYDTNSVESRKLPEIQIPMKRPLRRIAKQDSVEARIASADIKSIVRPKQLSAMQNQSRQANHNMLLCEDLVQKEECSGMLLRATPKFSDKLPFLSDKSVLNGVKNNPSLKSNDNSLLLVEDKVEEEPVQLEVASGGNSVNMASGGNFVNASGGNSLSMASGGDLLELAKTSMQCKNGKNNESEHSNEDMSDDSAYVQNITNIEVSVKQIILSDSKDDTTEGTNCLSVNGKYTPEKNCDIVTNKQNSVVASSFPLPVKSQHDEICKPYVVDLGVPFSRTNSPRYIETNLDEPEVEGENGSIPNLRSRKSSGNSVLQFAMPNTPTREKFSSPIARIDSFHSEDFDAIDNELRVICQSNATTPGSVNTPTFPCFAYKLQLHKRKNAKLKSTSKGKEDGHLYANDEKIVADKNLR